MPTLSQVMDAVGLPHRLIMYPPFNRPRRRRRSHRPFLVLGRSVADLGRDAIGFFGAYLRRQLRELMPP
jgi:hypothetical protein